MSEAVDEVVEQAPEPPVPDQVPDAGLPRWLVLSAVAVGVAARLVVLASPLGRPDADEVMAGLMVRHLSDGYPTFYWGQDYSGTPQLMLVSLSMRLFGDSIVAMRIPTIALSVANAVLVWRLALRILPPWRAQLAGLTAWVWPALGVWFGVREMLFYVPTVTLGLLMLLFAFRSHEHETAGTAVAALDIALVGLCFGVAWWVSPNIAYFVVPTAVVLAFGLRRAARRRVLALGAVLAVPAAALGALPWLQANRRSDWSSLHASDSFPVTGTYAERFGHFFAEGLPGALGFREIFTHDWVLPPLGPILWVVALAGLVVAAAVGLRRGDWDAVGFVAAPFLFAAVPFVLDDPNLRYLFFVLPYTSVLVARFAPRRVYAPLVVVAAVLLTIGGLVRLYAVSELDGRTYRVGNVGDLDAAIVALDEREIDAVFAEYWIAYRLLFETEEEIQATPSWGIERYRPAVDVVRDDEAPAWVVTRDSIQQFALLDSLDVLGVSYETVEAGDMTVVVTERPVFPEELPAAARTQTPGGMPRRSGG